MSTLGFVGFPDTKMKPVIVPDLFFSDLLPQIEDLGELKLTLHCFWLLNEQATTAKFLRGDDLRGDQILLRSLHLNSNLRTPQQALEDALERAVARNTLLKLEIESDTGGDSAAAKVGKPASRWMTGTLSIPPRAGRPWRLCARAGWATCRLRSPTRRG